MGDEITDRRRTVGDFKCGSIKTIRLHNFLTYEDAIIRPGPRCNMVVGANGTGKSSILNAICLGLGGEPKVLGRAEDARDFVMHGKETASIEITLAGEDGNAGHTIRRVIDRNRGTAKGKGRGSSTFYIDDEKVSAKDVCALVNETYQISIGNLCTFLPQDKVGSFSGITPQDLLLETEKTLASNGFFINTHQELIDAEEELNKGEGDVIAQQDKLQKLKRENEQLERAKNLIEERERNVKLVEKLEQKKVWKEYENLCENYKAVKDEYKQAKDEMKQRNESIKGIEENHVKLASDKKRLETKHKELVDEIYRCQKEMDKQCKKYDTHDEAFETVLSSLEEIDSQKSSRLAAYEACKKKVAEYEKEAKKCPSREELQEAHHAAVRERKATKQQYDAIKREVNGLEHENNEMNTQAASLQNKVAKYNDEGSQRKARVFQKFPNLKLICDWLDKNRGLFRRPVVGPIACEISPKSKNIAAYIEQHVPDRVLKAFVVETKEDHDLLYEKIGVEKKIGINVIQLHRSPPKRIYSDSKMQVLKEQHGVLGLLSDGINAPEAVTSALISLASIDRVLVGGKETKKSIDNRLLDFLEEPDVKLNQQGKQSYAIFAPDGDKSYKYTGTKSRYSNNVSMRQDDINPPRFLAEGANQTNKKKAEDDLAELHRRMQDFRQRFEEAKSQLQKLEVELQKFNSEVTSAKKRLDSLSKFFAKFEHAKAKLRDAEDALNADDTDEKRKLTQALSSRMKNIITSIEAHCAQQENYMAATTTMTAIEAERSVVSVLERAAATELIEAKEKLEDLKKKVVELNDAQKEFKKRALNKRKEAEEKAPIGTDDDPLPLRDELNELEYESLNEIEVALEDARSKVNEIEANPTVIKKYHERKREIEALEMHLENLTNQKEGKLLELKTKRKRWEHNLETKVQEINDRFSAYMGEMECTGEVVLSKGGPDSRRGQPQNNTLETGNFKDWGIEIRVSFRENCKAQVLNAQRHSGGERSVSTIMYLMAMQDMMVAPFRCVDEINQGLDERNERLVFSRIVQNSCDPPGNDGPMDHSGQYFLITPKLLPNLVDMEQEAMTILFVFNGPMCFDKPSDWYDKLLKLNRKRATRNEDSGGEDENLENSNGSRRIKSKKSRLSKD